MKAFGKLKDSFDVVLGRRLRSMIIRSWTALVILVLSTFYSMRINVSEAGLF